MINFKIAGTGVYIPKKVIKNEDFAEFLETSDEWITERTGIKNRHIETDLTTYEMASNSAKIAIEKSGLQASNIDMVVVSSSTSEYSFPSIACIIQKELSLENAFCFDVSAACTGFIYALDVVSQYFASGKVKNVLLVAAEKLSSVADYKDRSTCVLFGDSAASVVLTADDESGLVSSYLKSDGRGAGSLFYENIRTKSPWQNDRVNSLSNGEFAKLIMDGKEVYKFAVNAMVDSCNKAISSADIDKSEIKAVIPHQANIRIINSAIKKLDIAPEKFYSNIESFGNTSSASVPLILHELIENKTLVKGDFVLMTSFGAGLTYGAIILKI